MHIFNKLIQLLQNAGRAFGRFRWWQKFLVIIGGVIVFSFFMDWVAMPLYTRHGAEYELPDVTEKPVEQAIDILDDTGFIPIIQDSVYDSFYPAGSVVRQNPPSFSTVKKGRRVYLVVSSGARPVFMPNLVGETLINAKLKLRESGLALNEVNYDYSNDYPYRGVVIRQSVPPSEKVFSNASIDLTVSLGAPPSSLVMPSFAGKSLESALQELSVLGISSDKIITRYRYRPNLVPQTVISQSTPAGTPVSDVEEIELLVSTDQIPDRDTPYKGGADRN